MNDIVQKQSTNIVSARIDGQSKEQVYVTVYVENQLFGIPVEKVQDILVTSDIAAVPLAPSDIAGVINLRGRIVTVIDLRKKLGLPTSASKKKMCVTVELGSDLYSLMVDSVGSVLSLTVDEVEPHPTTLDIKWRMISSGVIKLDQEIMVILDVDTLIKNY